ncbi:hypothetical protein ScalyP_jg468 [Parmales sp. scaly parma]|nr:hypothetical protein ScalyP_jg468 [Parmales sp. scaly parma]
MSVRRNELEEIFGFLLLLWYSPLLQSVGQMFKCYNDPSLGWVLLSDTRVSCEGTPRNIVIVHAFLICTIIGVGLPLAIFVTTRRLRARGELRADSPLASIFEFYRPAVPYFESFHLLRKAMLILVVSTETFEAIGSLAINVVFLCLLVRKRPMVRFTSHIFKGSNLFHLAEVSASSTTIVGCLLAFAGSLEKSDQTETTVGALFTFVNLAFIVALSAGFVYEFKIEKEEEEMKRNSNRVDLEEGEVEMTFNPVLGARMEEVIFEAWHKAFRNATENDLTAAAKADLVAELPLEISRVIKLVRKEFLLTTKGVTIEDVESVRKRAADINVKLEKMQVDIDSLDLEETLTTFEKVPRVNDLFNEADGLNLRYCLAEIRFEQSLNLDENLPGWSATEKSKKDRPAGFQDTKPPPPSPPPPVRDHCESELLEWKRRSDQIKQILKSEKVGFRLGEEELNGSVVPREDRREEGRLPRAQGCLVEEGGGRFIVGLQLWEGEEGSKT